MQQSPLNWRWHLILIIASNILVLILFLNFVLTTDTWENILSTVALLEGVTNEDSAQYPSSWNGCSPIPFLYDFTPTQNWTVSVLFSFWVYDKNFWLLPSSESHDDVFCTTMSKNHLSAISSIKFFKRADNSKSRRCEKSSRVPPITLLWRAADLPTFFVYETVGGRVRIDWKMLRKQHLQIQCIITLRRKTKS